MEGGAIKVRGDVAYFSNLEHRADRVRAERDRAVARTVNSKCHMQTWPGPTSWTDLILSSTPTAPSGVPAGYRVCGLLVSD